MISEVVDEHLTIWSEFFPEISIGVEFSDWNVTSSFGFEFADIIAVVVVVAVAVVGR